MKTIHDQPAQQPASLRLLKEQLLTIGDLIEFKNELLHEMKQLLKEATGKPAKQWLKSHEVKKLLGLSSGTLQTLRDKGTIPFTRIGGVIYYNADEIMKMMEQHKSPIR